ncbi:MAG: carboxypeptidase-like regulatory domain-containing protein, partial [Oscillochloridaceae bacterium umkhey_bin13]
ASLSVSVSGNLSGRNFTATPISAATYTISGRVTTANGTGLAGVTVSTGARGATTDSTGAYRISGLVAGTHQLTAGLSGYRFSPSSRSVTVSTAVSGQDFEATRLSTSDTFDLSISLYNNPTGTQRIPYEEMLRYFADGVFEMSNGAHKLGTITIYPNAGRLGRADVQWVASCWPKAHVAGYGIEGWRIQMCDTFGATNFLQQVEDGGYTLAHEWGHYFYGLYDEYRGPDSCQPNDPGWPCNTDMPVLNSIMNDHWQAQGSNFAWLNFSTALNNTRNTAQHRVYLASGWETLVRPSELDPRDGSLRSSIRRPYFPALAAVAPPPGQAPRIDLVPGHTARSELQIVWTATLANLSTDEFVAGIQALDGGIVNYPDPIRLIATLQRVQMITGATASGEVIAPDGTRSVFTLRDDGVAPDPEAADGLYAALLNYRQNGEHTIRVRFTNPNGTAAEIFSGQPAPPPPGSSATIPPPVLINDRFDVETELTVIVTGVQTDDHGDTAATATALATTNQDTSGSIDRAGDRDLFTLTPTTSGRLVVRLSNLAFNLQPRLRILAADGRTELATRSGSGTEPLWVEVRVQAGQRLYAEVSDQRSGAFGGFYQISAGASLVSEPSATRDVYLPLIRR